MRKDDIHSRKTTHVLLLLAGILYSNIPHVCLHNFVFLFELLETNYDKPKDHNRPSYELIHLTFSAEIVGT